MLKRLLLLALFSLSITSLAFGQLFEDFEDGSTTGYTTGLVDLDTGSWFFAEALIGNRSGDAKNGSQSVRMDNRDTESILQMNFDYSDGVSNFSFLAANSGFSGDTGGILQAYISTDGGSNWSEYGEEIVVSNTLEQYSINVPQQGPVRLRLNTVAGGRINVDDFRIEPYVVLDDTPTIFVRQSGEPLASSDPITFPAAAVNASRSIDIEIRNNGEPNLDITSVQLSNGTAFSIDTDVNGSLASLESSTLTVTFTPPTLNDFSDVLTIETNDPDTPQFSLNLVGSTLNDGEAIPISQARNLPLGTTVTVAGRVTVADEFSGPVYFQDDTGGIAWFNDPLMRENGFNLEIARGDSLVITGELGEFNDLLQIVGSENAIEYEIYTDNKREILPVDITIEQLNSGYFEGQLIRINNFQIDLSGSFQGGINYIITDQSGDGELRVDPQSNVPNSQVPEQPMDAVGVAGHFNGIEQIIPRDTKDLNVEPFTYPGEDIPKDQTFDVVTWNIEWFGSSGNGPSDLDLQMNNVITVIETIDADLYALQEIASETRFFALVDSLETYSGLWAGYSQSQNTAYLYKSTIINSVYNGLLIGGGQEYEWASRLPFLFEFDATVEGVTRRINAFNIHAKAFPDEESYDRRTTASLRLKVYLDNNRQDDNVLFLGDYNDMLYSSSYNNEVSPYDNFVKDDNYYTVTGTLEQRGLNSYIAGQNQSMIDHITVTNDLIDDHIDGAQRVENPNYIGSYISTTSDHAPVWTRFDFTRNLVSIDEPGAEAPQTFALEQNYPNPFNPTTNISFTLPERSAVSLKVYDVMGREVATLANNRSFTGGSHSLTFNASSLASGMYIYRLTVDNGMTLSRKMMIVK